MVVLGWVRIRVMWELWNRWGYLVLVGGSNLLRLKYQCLEELMEEEEEEDTLGGDKALLTGR